MPAPLINRTQLESAFDVLSEKLVARAAEATVVLFGDAAMMFAHDARTEIHHVDAAATPRGQTMGAAREAAQQLDLPLHWFTDERAGSLPKHLDDDIDDLWVKPNLVVKTLSAELLLAITALAPNRPEDIDDIRTLAASLGITSSIDVEVLVAEIYPGRTLGGKARETLDGLL
ncbi:MAG: hypothetical protein ABIR32_16405 [Ilumatobacteraceae bacterium]